MWKGISHWSRIRTIWPGKLTSFMSYIHDALKKAQREKDSLVSKYSDVWSSVRSRRRLLNRGWLVTTGLIVASVALSAYSWLHSLDELPLHPAQNPGVHRAIVKSSAPLHSGSNGESHAGQSAVTPGTFRVQRQPTRRPVPAPASENAKKEAQRPLPSAGQPSPEGEKTLYSQALALQKEGRLEDAKKLYERALERSPHLASALNNLGVIYIKEKNYDMARRTLEKAIRMDPGYVDPYYNLACLHALQNDVGRSLAYLKKAISVNKAVRQWAKSDEDLRNLRGQSEYEKIIQGA
jgi:tetratricopeptide (TPR) repeat protein